MKDPRLGRRRVAFSHPFTRREFLAAAAAAGGVSLAPSTRGVFGQPSDTDPLFRISLAEWSLNRIIFGPSRDDPRGFGSLLRTDPDAVLQGTLDPLDFARTARRDFDIDAIEYVNQFFFGHARDEAYLRQMKQRADDEGVRSLLIMCDAEGNLGAPDTAERTRAIENHHKWVDAAAFLGCHSVRVNARSDGTWDEQARLAADGLARLVDYADPHGIDVIVENHGGLSSNGQWLSSVMEMADHPRLGTLPDFGNFNLGDGERYDNYQGVTEMMPYATAVSAKSHDFDADGNDTTIDFERMMRIVLDAGYRGYVGIEYEGRRLSEPDGIRATKVLLERVRDELRAEY